VEELLQMRIENIQLVNMALINLLQNLFWFYKKVYLLCTGFHLGFNTIQEECNDGSNGGGLHSAVDVHNAIDRDAHVAGIEGGRKLYWSDDADSNRKDVDETGKSGGGVS